MSLFAMIIFSIILIMKKKLNTKIFSKCVGVWVWSTHAPPKKNTLTFNSIKNILKRNSHFFYVTPKYSINDHDLGTMELGVT